MRVMKYLNGTKGGNLTLSADNLRVVKWYVDTSFAVHPDFKSHTGAMMTLGKGAIQSIAKCTTPKRQAVVKVPEVNYELSLVTENVKRELEAIHQLSKNRYTCIDHAYSMVTKYKSS
jgi:hypothetical protein